MTNRFFCDDIDANKAHLSLQESQHCIKVLRLKQGENIKLLDGKGNLYEGIIQEPNPKKSIIKIINKKSYEKRKLNLTVCFSPPKSIDRLEWFVEKAVEIGIEEIFFMKCSRSERKNINMERIEKKAISALKQSGNKYLPRLHELKPLKDILSLLNDHQSQKYLAHLMSGRTSTLKDLMGLEQEHFTIMIGPEGDFTDSELELCLNHNFRGLSLGDSVLRTETAAVHICSFVAIKNELKGPQ
ncbi:MAG: RsmE family RNA methyltransferase [Bacteroidota bacterium]